MNWVSILCFTASTLIRALSPSRMGAMTSCFTRRAAASRTRMSSPSVKTIRFGCLLSVSYSRAWSLSDALFGSLG